MNIIVEKLVFNGSVYLGFIPLFGGWIPLLWEGDAFAFPLPGSTSWSAELHEGTTIKKPVNKKTGESGWLTATFHNEEYSWEISESPWETYGEYEWREISIQDIAKYLNHGRFRDYREVERERLMRLQCLKEEALKRRRDKIYPS